MRMTNIQENNNNYDNNNNNNNNNNNPKPTSRIPSLQHSWEPPQKMNYSLFDFVIFFFTSFFRLQVFDTSHLHLRCQLHWDIYGKFM